MGRTHIIWGKRRAKHPGDPGSRLPGQNHGLFDLWCFPDFTSSCTRVTNEPELEGFGSEMLLTTTRFPNSQVCGPSEQLGTH